MGIFEKVAGYFSSGNRTKQVTLLGRNEPCRCGSGIKYKKCHLPEDEKKSSRSCAANCGPA